MRGEEATWEELGVLLVRDLEDGKLYATTPFPTARFIKMPKGLVVTLIPKKDLIIFHSKIGDPLIARRVETPDADTALLYKLIRGRKSDIDLLTELAKSGMLSAIFERKRHIIGPYLGIPEIRRRVERIIGRVRAHNPNEAKKLRELLTNINQGRYLEAYRHPPPTTERARPNLPVNEKIILSKEEIKRYLKALDQ